MSPFWLVVAAAVLSAAALLAYFEVIKPLRQVRRALRKLAEKDFSTGPLSATPGLFRETNRDLGKITELLRQFDRQLADEGFSLRAILSSMVEGVLIADRSQRIRLANDALVGFLGLPSPPINRPVIEIFRKHELQRALEAALEQEKPQEIEISMEVMTPSGRYATRHFDVHIVGLMPGPRTRPAAALVVFHDVTAVRNLEETRREFLANVSHEFRTPLAIINGYLETLMDGAIEDREMAEKSLRAMHKNSRRLSLLIDDLLAISRLEERANPLAFREVDLREILSHALEHLDPNIAERSAAIEIDWPPGIGKAEADARRIEQVFSNLLSNALRYGDVPHLRIRISAVQSGSRIVIRFSDNGQGIPLADQPHIFERFYRVHKDRSRDAGGTGLGLSIVQSVIQAHGGTVTVESLPGQGASFEVILPVTQKTPA